MNPCKTPGAESHAHCSNPNGQQKHLAPATSQTHPRATRACHSQQRQPLRHPRNMSKKFEGKQFLCTNTLGSLGASQLRTCEKGSPGIGSALNWLMIRSRSACGVSCALPFGQRLRVNSAFDRSRSPGTLNLENLGSLHGSSMA